MQEDSRNLLVVLGPTASGKTRLGVRLASHFGGNIVSADSRQVYRGLDIGAGKDLGEYKLKGRQIAHHMIDIVDLDVEFSVFDFQQRFYLIFEELTARSALPVMVGGSGLYLEAALLDYELMPVKKDVNLRTELADKTDGELESLLRSLKSDLHNTTDLVDRQRMTRAIEIAIQSHKENRPDPPSIRPLVLGTRWERSVLRERIKVRLARRMEAGLVEEVERLLRQGVSLERLDRLGLEYRYVARFLKGEIADRKGLFDELSAAIGKFAKRQLSWFRRMERRGVKIHWVAEASFDEALGIVERYFEPREDGVRDGS